VGLFNRDEGVETMPTGFTQVLFDKPDTTFATFALRCARGMGVCIHMRDVSLDVPPPEVVEPYKYHREALDKAQARMRELETMAPDEAQRQADAEHAEALRFHQEGVAREKRERESMTSMLAEVAAWVPPTTEHEGLKRFMTEQLTISMPSDYYAKQPTPKKQRGWKWLEEAKTKAARDVEYHAGHWREDRERATKATDWLQALRDAL
jgi:hypothetical protein